MSNWNLVETQWTTMATQVKARWNKLSVAEIAVIGGKRSLLVAKLQENYNIFQLEAENQVNAWTTKLAKAAEAAAAPPVVEGAAAVVTAGSDEKTAPAAPVVVEGEAPVAAAVVADATEAPAAPNPKSN